jgi:hypothetical protein
LQLGNQVGQGHVDEAAGGQHQEVWQYLRAWSWCRPATP